MPEIVVRSAVEGDTERILDTLKAALGESPLLRRTPALWAWKHKDNPFGPSTVLVAEDGDRIAGVRAMMRWDLTTPEGHRLRCLRPVDTATHPDFVRRGIFRELTTVALELARSDGIDLIFNTPNDQSAPGYLKMGWRRVSDLGVLVRPRLGPSVRPSPNSIPSTRQFAPSLQALTGEGPNVRDRDPRGLRTPRSDKYLRWRFGMHPTASYAALSDGEGVVVARANWRGSRSELVVSDLLGQPGSGAIRRLARKSRARYLAGWFSPGSPERRVAVLGGMLPIPRTTLQLIALPVADVDIDVFDLASWDLATSDLELL
ncbi:MAG TPA: GNAT family N-acetyltransferase [Acidimicrobiia bacterium]|nr:GNAT family N-acetyltransferase [Acidimicrobiia bacterium]